MSLYLVSKFVHLLIFSLVNWRPLSTEESELFDKRREHHVKNRRKFWVMQQNPKTETYFAPQWSDRNIAQYEWSNSGWFRLTANQWWSSSFWITVSRILYTYIYHLYIYCIIYIYILTLYTKG